MASMAARRILPRMTAAARDELKVVRARLEALVRRRYTTGLSEEETMAYERLTAREVELLRAIGLGLPDHESVAAEG